MCSASGDRGNPGDGSSQASQWTNARATRIERVGVAIDKLAEDSCRPASAESPSDVLDRVAALWAMIADLDPELAKRMSGYTTTSEQHPSSR